MNTLKISFDVLGIVGGMDFDEDRALILLDILTNNPELTNEQKEKIFEELKTGESDLEEAKYRVFLSRNKGKFAYFQVMGSDKKLVPKKDSRSFRFGEGVFLQTLYQGASLARSSYLKESEHVFRGAARVIDYENEPENKDYSRIRDNSLFLRIDKIFEDTTLFYDKNGFVVQVDKDTTYFDPDWR